MNHFEPVRLLRLVTFGLCFLNAPTVVAAIYDEVIGTALRFLESNTEQYLQQNHLDGRKQIEFAPLDSRLPLKTCQKPLEPSLVGSTLTIGRVTVRVRCISPAWTLLLSARVSVYQRVLAAAHPLKRGQRVNEADLTWVERDIGVLGQGGWLTDIKQVQGQQLTRPIGTGKALLSTQLKPRQLIAPGDFVRIVSRGDGIYVQISGEALSGGSLGQQIRVRNLSSGRVLRARIIASALVEAGT